MNAFETINDLRDELASDTQAHAAIARDHYNQQADMADLDSDRFEYKSKAERANAIWWVCQAETWANMGEAARNRTWGGAAEASFAAREHEAEAEHCATRADIMFDRSVYYQAEGKRHAETEE